MALIDIEDIALLEDEVSLLRSENEYLKITVDGTNAENAQLTIERDTLLSDRLENTALLAEVERLKATVLYVLAHEQVVLAENTALLAEVEQLKATVRGWEIDNGAPLTEAELAARPKPTHRLVTPPDIG